MTLKLRQKIILLALIAGLLPVLVIVVGSYRIKMKTGATLINELTVLSKATVTQVAGDVYALCETVNNMIQSNLHDYLIITEKTIEHDGGLALSPEKTVTWTLINKDTDKTETITLPQMMLGDTPIEPVYDLADDSPQPFIHIVDGMRVLGGTCTIFQRMNEEGDMLRIATSVVNADGRRSIGTYIPHTSEVVKKVLAGQMAIGRFMVLNKWVMASYKPYYRDGRIIGMLYCGMAIDEIKSIEKEISGIKFGKSGYVTVILGEGPERGKYIIAPQDKNLIGKNIFHEHSGNNNYFNQLISRAISSEPGKVIEGGYTIKLANFSSPRENIAAVVFYKPWNWIIVAGTFLDELNDTRASAEHSIQIVLLRFVAVGLALFILILIAIFFFSGTISKPISRVAAITRNVSAGNISLAADLTEEYFSDYIKQPESARRDETSQLIYAVSEMTLNLNELVGQVQHSSVQLLSNATQVAATAKQQEGSLSELGSSTSEIAASIKQISATSSDLAGTMNKVTAVADETTSLADDGRQGLVQMEDQMRELATATSSISSKLALINDKTANISNVVTTINKIAEQTNLLSLN
ncbi:MAG TPA: methyl-accepting chemotaxis protein, partial [Phycisphaerae bacterium]|nr:methyl-accepting chemotaxis protein [Phycisphaerae bacterium]